ncbi:MAG TPA: hypothetical protein VJU16_09035 [Planctomycetota bacterium]|nr:hypothetical protein [Planctomycetota bacterium]
MRRFLTAIITLSAWTVPVAVAQHSEGPDSTKKPHGRTFSTGTREGWTFSTPHIDIGGGVYMEPNHDPKVSEGFFRLHMQTAVGPKLLELAVDALWLPGVSANPVLTAVIQAAPLPEHSPFYFGAGGGVITGSRLEGWVQAEFAFRTKIHELTPFISVGKALVSGSELELQIGIAHPLAPYLFHIP